jgi:hypothetical protein
MIRKYLALSTWIAILLMQTSPNQLRVLAFSGSSLVSTSYPVTSTIIEPALRADLDQDGSMETVTLVNASAFLISAGETAWQSPPTWQVMEAEMTDLDNDGIPEAALLVWRPFRPWPVDQWLPEGGRIGSFHDPRGNSCQIILIGWQRNAYREIWAGSALAEPVKSFAAVDLDGDGRQELVTLESSYSESIEAPAKALKVWEWNGFGFSNLARINGLFSKMAFSQGKDGRILIITP